LQIQVVRLVDQQLWKMLAQAGSVTRATTVPEAAAALAATIQHKTTIPPAQHPTLVLVVNALDTPGHALAAVVDMCRRTYGAELVALGFSAIWVVGQTAALTLRVDTRGSAIAVLAEC
jgi:hypothetical protein